MSSSESLACAADVPSQLATSPGQAFPRETGAQFAIIGPGKVELGPGSLVGGYRIEHKLAEGGMGTVYVATHVILPRRVALKVLRPELTDTPLARDSLLQEGRILETLLDSRIARIYDAGYIEEGRPWIAMELIEGECLADLLARNPKLTVPEVAQLACATVDALGAAHAAGVVHSDVKPENVMVYQSPTGPIVKMIDWGIARVAASTTSQAWAVGTPHYMSPEQVRGDAFDSRADIYALGVLTYELLAGRTPFNGDTPADIAMHHLRTAPSPLRSLRRDVPPAIESLVAAMLAKEPSARPSLETVRACFGLVSDAALMQVDDTTYPKLAGENALVPTLSNDDEVDLKVEVEIDYTLSDDVVHDGTVTPRWTPPHGRPTSDDLSSRTTMRFGRILNSGGKQVASVAGTIRKLG